LIYFYKRKVKKISSRH